MNPIVNLLPVLQALALFGMLVGAVVVVVVIRSLLKKEDEKYQRDYVEFLEAKRRVQNRIKGNKNGI